MKLKPLFYAASVALLCACGSNTPTTSPAQDVAVQDTTSESDCDKVDTVLADSVPSETLDLDPPAYGPNIMKHVLELLLNEKEADLADAMARNKRINSNSMAISEEKKAIRIYPDIEQEPCGEDCENPVCEGCVGGWNIVCLERNDGYYQVLYFSNYDDKTPFEVHLTKLYLSYIYDGRKLTKNNFQLPKPKLVDFMNDGVLYYKLNPETVERLKNETADSCIYQLDFYDSKQLVIDVYNNLVRTVQNESRLYNSTLSYNWDGEKFVKNDNFTYCSIDDDAVGTIRLGDVYTGQEVDGYKVVKTSEMCYDLKKNGKVSLEIITNSADKIATIRIYNPKLGAVILPHLGINMDLEEVYKDRRPKMRKSDDGIVSFVLYDYLRCDFYYKDIKSCNEAEDGSLTDVVFNPGAKLICLTIGNVL